MGEGSERGQSPGSEGPEPPLFEPSDFEIAYGHEASDYGPESFEEMYGPGAFENLHSQWGSLDLASPDVPDSSVSPITTTYRCAWPTLRPIPLERDYLLRLPKDIRDNSVRIQSEARKILRELGIVAASSDIDISRARSAEPDADTAVPTLLIIAEWEQNSTHSWKEAVKAVASYVTTVLGSDHGLAIDMIAHERVDEQFLGPVLNQPDLAEAWPTIRSFAQQRLEVHRATKSRMTTIALFRMGFHSTPSYNPVTLYISVDYKSDESRWPDITQDIARGLSRMGWDTIHIHIEHNMPERYPFPLNPLIGSAKKVRERREAGNHLIEGEYQRQVNMGESMGAYRYLQDDQGNTTNPSSGTLGCYLQIQRKGQPPSANFALTNYHVIRPCLDGFRLKTKIRPLDEDTKQGLTPEEQEEDSKTRVPDAPERYSNLWKADHKGFGVRQFPETLVESPARIKHNYTIWSLDQDIRFELQAGTDPEDAAVRTATQEKADKLNFFDQDNHKLGRVVLASGFGRRAVREPATEGKRRLDWAVIEVDAARQGANMIPSFDTWKAKYQDYNLCPPRNICGTLLKPEPGSLKDIKPDETIWKVASTTGPTAGVLSPDFKPISTLLDDEYMGDHSSVESVVIGHPQASTTGDGVFALPGDSGGIAFNKEGVAVGLVFTGQRPKQSKQGLSYVTPLDDAFDDMMTMTQSSPSQILEITLAQN
ncbi:hypothetical protein NCS57_01233300 [Fusarium keratoplasticum]|uniref:Uncharacterized protein n=1 Tax=Fusarium keratoplasticum TaxID=1328300 RepID=A0ACC0QKV3_9HYPO|nr:hypothetical protein NCS57_01233300 [Fusarium keratoplasticum]KAI8654862.1 hypothetical protein NCS57_01233300 [Fusarium keratoplasticum]KAI8655706.1 hypothetical protein NCS55_01223400 [Fusarium keratoplasticum]